jgi:hypothetical protein
MNAEVCLRFELAAGFELGAKVKAMKTLAALFLSLTLPGAHVASPPRPLANTAKTTQQARKGGVWYFAETGHAVFCYGPVMYVQDAQGGLSRVATFCSGDRTIVPLKD